MRRAEDAVRIVSPLLRAGTLPRYTSIEVEVLDFASQKNVGTKIPIIAGTTEAEQKGIWSIPDVLDNLFRVWGINTNIHFAVIRGTLIKSPNLCCSKPSIGAGVYGSICCCSVKYFLTLSEVSYSLTSINNLVWEGVEPDQIVDLLRNAAKVWAVRRRELAEEADAAVTRLLAL